MEVRSSEFYKVEKYQTERFKRSAIPSMIRLLNDCQKKKEETFKKLNAMPVNHVCCSLHITAIIINYNNNLEHKFPDKENHCLWNKDLHL